MEDQGHRKAKVPCKLEQLLPFHALLRLGMLHSEYCLHSAFLGTRPILVRIFRSKKKTTVLAIQITSATQKAVLQL